MDLFTSAQKTALKAAIDNIHDSFKRPITIIKRVRTAKSGAPTENDNFDFTQQSNNQSVEFEESSTQTTVDARIKYIDRQEVDSQFVGNQLTNLSIEGGIIRIKVKKEDGEAVLNADDIIVDGLNTKIKFIDTRHGLFDIDYSTFYLQRTP